MLWELCGADSSAVVMHVDIGKQSELHCRSKPLIGVEG